MTQLLDRETWSRLDPGAARLPRHSGIVWPHFADGDEWGGHGHGANVETLEVSHSVLLRNDGWTEVTVMDIGRVGPGITLLGSNTTFPWGSITAYVAMPTYSNPPQGLTQYSYSGADPYATQWQRELANRACSPDFALG